MSASLRAAATAAAVALAAAAALATPVAAAGSVPRGDLRLGVVFTGAGSETITYAQPYRSDCAGAGGFTDAEVDTVGPMSWTARYTVDIPLGRGSQTAVPTVTYDPHGSRLNARESVVRSFADLGCSGPTTTTRCTTRFRLGGPDAGTALTLTGDGLQVGLPLLRSSTGTCTPSAYPLGPSLWAAGGAAAFLGQFKLLGGQLPRRPYAPVRVSWPHGAAAEQFGFPTSPCQGDAGVCQDAFAWQGTVRLIPGG